MHVENRMNRAFMTANDYAIKGELYEDSTESEKAKRLERLATMFLLAELINAIQGLDYKGNPQSSTGSVKIE